MAEDQASGRAMTTGRLQAIRSRALTIGVAQAVIWTVLCLALSVAAPAVAKAFHRTGTPLPDITSGVLDFAVFLRRSRHLGIAAACCWPLVNWGVVWLLSRDPEVFIVRRLWYLATWILPIVAAIFALAALMVPLMALHRLHLS